MDGLLLIYRLLKKKSCLSTPLSCFDIVNINVKINRFVQMDVPKEKGITDIPNSFAQHSLLDKKPIFSGHNFTSNSLYSLSCLNSNYLGDSRDMNVII